MPHIIVKVRAGYPQAKKARLAEALSKAIVETLDCPTFDVSIGIEDVAPTDWAECVYRPDILDKPETIYREPGYTLPK
jgi:4-oxalocrotonate tautomerase